MSTFNHDKKASPDQRTPNQNPGTRPTGDQKTGVKNPQQAPNKGKDQGDAGRGGKL